MTTLGLQAGGGWWSVVSASSFSPFLSRIRFSTTLEDLLYFERLKGLRKNLHLFAFPLCGNLLGLFFYNQLPFPLRRPFTTTTTAAALACGG